MDLVRRPIALGPLALWLYAVIQPQVLPAQYQKYEGMTITNIQFDPHQQPLAAAELHDLLPIAIGSPLRIATIRESIEKLFATGRYADIQVDAQPYRNGAAVTFVTRTAWFTGAVSAGGSVSIPPNVGQLENAANLPLGEPYTDKKLQDAVADQKRLLESNGLFRAKITPSLDWEST